MFDHLPFLERSLTSCHPSTKSYHVHGRPLHFPQYSSRCIYADHFAEAIRPTGLIPSSSARRLGERDWRLNLKPETADLRPHLISQWPFMNQMLMSIYYGQLLLAICPAIYSQDPQEAKLDLHLFIL